MYQIQNITDSPNQVMTVTLPDGSSISLQIYFSLMQQGWFILNLTYKTFTLTGTRITTNPNILRQYKNQIPFGLSCVAVNDREPTQQEDFLSDSVQLFILNSSDVEAYESSLMNV